MGQKFNSYIFFDNYGALKWGSVDLNMQDTADSLRVMEKG